MNAVITGLLIPFVGTSAGAACVFFLKKDLKRSVQRALTGFAAGVMVAASIWSLIVPAIEQSSAMGQLAFLPAFLGFWAGILFLLLLDHVIPHLHRSIDQTEGPNSHLTRTAMMVLAVTLHNIPEGMAVGVVYAGLLSGSVDMLTDTVVNPSSSFNSIQCHSSILLLFSGCGLARLAAKLLTNKLDTLALVRFGLAE